ncbi:glycerol-3-phosphate acyltransferase [Bartonella henselae]|uniref:Glycerol-3-phosphate acyltransferase n=2 Tax=Bartonella TaxID=773 RepID=PLSY_BARHE|nr:glycerol-3-phosphate 1-O-acyltransferase PlsY [Bartonella henselae]Q6G3F5.1 RecName: Full=Glycerol-3-phosphate acyltransferase; AltName: Full=Acyl-PO4 G3P acyltransferase; AltName: Full=Acyl-phosphate--glycerol-3-phosphate acyltransferase; AltName: Full=G3P acyltransferase; Short=GPAT; AltName: Full=Lysophosphatidic acid synthase; Short=LPA synthase [Bartonella henselae str. Houston-1]ATP12328.1 glycerol-3-phosphate acyltransferase [Bartonella henselae]ETS07333.1 glycerol-3-phosphate acyltran
MNEGEILFQFTTWLIFLISYLIGSIPFGLLLTKLAKLGDVRTIGSGNIGATNVLRTGNKKVAALTLLCDILKGTLVILVIKFLTDPIENNIFISLAGFFAFLGHLFPVWLKFKGGKGVATYLGVCLGLYWPAAIVFITAWIVLFLITRYSSLSALIAVIITPIFVHFSYPYLYAHCILVIMSLLVMIKHHANIGRLLVGKESKIGTQNGGK